MWTQTPEGRALVNGITHDVVGQVAPEEMDLFDELMADFFNGPPPEANGRSNGDDPLAFGFEGILVAATPAVAAMVTAAVKYIAQEVIKAAQEESATVLTTRIRAFFRPKVVKESLSSDQIRRIYEIARAEALASGLLADEADRMARALVGTLTLAV